LFRRKVVPSRERNYKQLNVYYAFSNNANTIFQNLPAGEQLLGTIDYTNTGTTSASFSHLCIGNFKFVPSGDGKYLVLVGTSAANAQTANNAMGGTNPNSLPVAMDNYIPNADVLSVMKKQ